MKKTAQSQAQTLLIIRLAMVTVASLTICRADPKVVENMPSLQEIIKAPAIHHSDWRKALHAEFKYTPTTLSDSPAPPEVIYETPANPDVVVLPKYVVRDAAPGFRELERVIRNEEENARSETLCRKLGISIHAFKYKNVIFGYKTLFFIPMSFGAAW
jgi:hypothetical protein